MSFKVEIVSMSAPSESGYAYLTEEVIEQFSGSGSENLIQFLQASDQTKEQLEEISSLIFTELLLVYEEKKLSVDEVVQFLVLAISDESFAVIFCEVLDVFPLSEPVQNLLLEIYKRQSIIKYSTLARYIDAESLSKLSIVPTDVLNRQLNTRKRDDFYTQKKYNLLHEEIEGFSKLIIELYSIFRRDESSYQVDYALEIVENLIGHYSLDPNRVLDIILDIFSNNFVSNHEFSINFLKKSRWWPEVEGDCFTSIQSLGKGGNESAAKCIGLKLMKCPQDRDLPETYKIMIACLMKEGFLSFGSIWKYARPNDEEMKDIEALYKKELDEQVFKASASALALAAPLADDEDNKSNSEKLTTSMSRKDTNKDKTVAERIQYNFKYQLLRVFLGNGLYWPSIYILTEYSFLAFVSPDMHELIARMFSCMIEPLYKKIAPFSDEDFAKLQKGRPVTFAKPLNTVKLEEFQSVEYLSFKPTIKSFSQKKFRYFYSDWTKKLPLVNTVDELFKVSKDFLKFIGTNLSQNLELFSKICDIGVWDLQNDSSDTRTSEWFAYFRNFLLPTIPLIKENSFAVDRAYEILKFFTTEEKFNLYSELHQVLGKNNPHIKMAQGKAEKATKDVLKRLSKENVRPMMRRLAKISFSNPLPCFLTILQQIESYDNLNTLVVETARYFNQYGWDVLTLAILLRLTASGRSNIQNDGLNERQWIQSLASFIGKLCQRYPKSVDLKTLFQYLLKSFHKGETSSIIVLREILISMGGIQTIANLTLQQINMINCGSSLQKMVYRTIDDVRFERFRSGNVLTNLLNNIGVVNELLVLLCNLGDVIVYSSEHSHLKVLANKNDELNSLLHLFTQHIGFFSDYLDLKKSLLPLTELVSNYGVPIEWAFEIWRPFLSKAIQPSENVDQDAQIILKDLKDQISKLQNDDIWKYFSPDFYATFWQLSLYDINFSEELYDTEIERLNSTKNGLVDTINISKKDRDVSRSTIENYRKELSQNEVFIKDLPQEKESHKKHNDFVMETLGNDSSNWLHKTDNSDLQAKTFIQYCVLPRAIHSSFDAAYTAKFLFKLHDLETSNFSIINILDSLVNSEILFGTLFTLTPTEAENLGLFFADILRSLNDWTDQSVFEKVNDITVILETISTLSFDEYRLKLYQYHSTILNDVSRALNVEDYMCRRNAITFMKNLLGVYPTVEDHCEKIVELIEKIALKEHREDLKLSSSALIGHFKSRSKDWVHLWDFIPLSDSEKEEHAGKRKAIQDKIAEAKKKKEEEARQKELKAKQEAENNKQKKLASVISYDESASTNKRIDSRGSDASKGRYDYYSKYDLTKATNDDKTEGSNDDKTTSKSSKDSTENKSSNTELEKTTSEKDKSPEGTDKTQEAKNTKSNDLKSRLKEAKKEYEETKSRDFTPSSKASTPVENETKKEQATGIPLAPKNATLPAFPRETAPRTRTPLAPQPSTKKDLFYNDNGQHGRRPNDRTSYNNQNNRYNNQRNIPTPPTRPPNNLGYNSQNQGGRTGQRMSLPPPPPPPISLKNSSSQQSQNQMNRAPQQPQSQMNRAPQQQSRNDNHHRGSYRYDGKRKHDNYGNGRGYDKKQRY